MKLIFLNAINTVIDLLFRNRKLYLTTSLQFRKRSTSFAKNSFDYVRLSTLEILNDEVKERKVEGSIAELGVYKGDFAQHLNFLFPERKLYLFDTFEGFHPRDRALEKKLKFSGADQDFSDTSVNYVISKMPYPEQCVVKKGYFPETANGLDETFAIVSIDTDLYEPIYEGLKYFYPRLSVGGYILVHDYNNDLYKGAKQAVRDFCLKNGVPYVPVPDSAGSVIISR